MPSKAHVLDTDSACPEVGHQPIEIPPGEESHEELSTVAQKETCHAPTDYGKESTASKKYVDSYDSGAVDFLPSVLPCIL